MHSKFQILILYLRDDTEMADLSIVLGEQRRNLVVHYRAVELVAGKTANRVERMPQRDDDDLDAAVGFALEQPRTAISGDGRQLRQHHAVEMIGVLHGAFPRRPRRPHAL